MSTQLRDYHGNAIDPKTSGGGGGGGETRSVKILCYGNSFTQDSMSYVPTILKQVCPQLDFVIAIAFIGGCPLAQHYANFSGQSQTVPKAGGAEGEHTTSSQVTMNMVGEQ